jgi:hypothetical protein
MPVFRRLGLGLLVATLALLMVGPRWPSPMFYLVLVPAIAILAVVLIAPRSTVGMAAVLATAATGALVIPFVVLAMMYVIGLPVPLLLQDMGVVWPQLLMFPTVLDTPAGKVLPYTTPDWMVLVVTVVAWALLGIGFGLMVQRVSSIKIVAALAVGFVAAVTYGLVKMAPLLGWKYLLEFP